MNLALKRMTASAYFDWLERQPNGRFELVNGQVVAMNPQRVEHIETKLAVAVALRDALRGSSCHTLADGMAVKIDDATVYEPDALVYCGERLPRGATVFSNPVVVVEILSPGTKTVDTTRKLEGYFKLESVRHYLIVDPEQRTVVHHARDNSGSIATSLWSSGDLTLAAIGTKIPVESFFAG
jgi:Uma2 family endonuclease